MPKSIAPFLLFPTIQVPFAAVAMAIAILVSWLAFSVRVLVIVVIAESVYLGADLLGRFASYFRRRVEGPYSHIIKDFSDKQLNIIYRRKQFWGHRLLGSMLQSEFDRRKHIRNDVEYMKGKGTCEYVDEQEYGDWVRTRIQEISNLSDNAFTVLNEILDLSPDGRGDSFEKVEDISIAANHLVEIWEDVADWMIRCRSVKTDDDMQKLPHALSGLGQNIFNELLQYGYEMVPYLDQAVSEASKSKNDEDVKVFTYTMTLTASNEDHQREVTEYLSRKGIHNQER